MQLPFGTATVMLALIATGVQAQVTTLTRPPTHAASAANGAIPRGRDLPAFVYDAVGDRLLLFGGTLLSPDSRTFAWKDEQWSVVSDSGPYYRDDMAAASMGDLGALVFFGGHSERVVHGQQGRQQVALRETWRFMGSKWSRVDSAGPDARVHVQGAYDPARRRFVVFGGTLGAGGDDRSRVFARDTWEWDGVRWTKVGDVGPPGRMGFVMAYDTRSKMVIIHGGVRNNVEQSDTWGWDGKQWKRLATDGPKSLYGAATTNPTGGVVLFGGDRLSGPSAPDTWLWDGKSWRSVAATGPGPRSFHALATDTKRKRVYLIGGGEGFWYMDTNFKWTRVSLPG